LVLAHIHTEIVLQISDKAP